jgi:putative RNA 2'-phosphotransferase
MKGNGMDLVNISKFVSLILRHKPEVVGISLDKYGWANVDELVRGIQSKYLGFTKFHLEDIVANDDKQRYSFSDDKTCIRANQGHSINVDVELKEAQPPEFLWHGTGQKYVQSICSSGLLSKSRLYVHLSADMRTAINVGKRHGDVALFRIDAEQMYKDGFKFYLSKNGVWLTKEVPVRYLGGTIVVKE